MKEENEESVVENTTEESKGGEVRISEEFQRKVTALLDKANADECDFVCDIAHQRQQELYKEESKDDKDSPIEYSTEGMP